MMAAETLQALAQGYAAVLVLSGHAQVWQLAALAAAGGVGFGFYYPAAQGLLPQTVQAGELASANAIFRTGRNAASIGGAAVGGVLTGLAGPGWALAAGAATFAAAAALRAGMRFERLPRVQSAGTFRDLRDGWREFTSRRWLWAVVAQFSVVTGIYAAVMQVLGPLTAHAHLGGARTWGLTSAAYALGAVCGGLVMTRYRPGPAPRRRHAVDPGLFAAAVRARGAAAGSARSRRGPGGRRKPGGVHHLLGQHAAAGDTARQAVPHRIL